MVKERDAKIEDLGRQLDEAQTEVAGVRTELDKVQASDQATVAAEQSRIRELSDQLVDQSAALDREREMLAANRDIRDLMSARNLHIADVFDTDSKGKTRAGFGRVFFTEGKSLIIYAYDLNDRHVQEAGLCRVRHDLLCVRYLTDGIGNRATRSPRTDPTQSSVPS